MEQLSDDPTYTRFVKGLGYRELKQRRFWATHVNRKLGLLPYYMPWR